MKNFEKTIKKVQLKGEENTSRDVNRYKTFKQERKAKGNIKRTLWV